MLFKIPKLLVLLVLAGLVGYAAASLASGLAGSLALAAAALGSRSAQILGLKCLDSFHDAFLPSVSIHTVPLSRLAP